MNPMVIWPPLIQDYLVEQQQAQPHYDRPLPPQTRQPSLGSNAWVAVGASTIGIIGSLLLTGERSGQLIGLFGLLGVGGGMWGLWLSLNEELTSTQQEQWQNYQSLLQQWENAQRLLKRARKRQLRQRLAGKIRQPTAKKSICPNSEQEALIASLKHHCPHLNVYLGWEFVFEEEVFRPFLTLVDEETGLSLALVTDLTPTWQKFFNEGNWGIVQVSEKPMDLGVGLAQAIALID